MITYLAIAALAISLLSLVVAGRIALFNYRIRGIELRHQLLRDAAAVQERLVLAKLHLEKAKALAAGTAFEADLSGLDFPSGESLASSLDTLEREYRALSIHQAVQSHAAYQDKLLQLQRWVAQFEIALGQLEQLAEARGPAVN